MAVLAAVLAWGCSGGEGGWRTTDVTGVLPDLELSLHSDDMPVLEESDLAGQVVVLFFGYTSCPDVCPITLAKLRSTLQRLDKDRRRGVTVLFVSVDPRRDSAERLAGFTQAFGPRFVGATTGDLKALRELTSRYASSFSYGEPGSEGEYAVSHGSSAYVFDGRGRARLIVRPDDEAADIAQDLRRLL